MSKRSAMVLAAVVTMVLAVGALALSLGLTGPSPAAADEGSTQRVIRVQHRTITVHRQADGDTSTIVALASSANGALGASIDGDGEDGFENESDDTFEVEDHVEAEDD